MRVLIVGLGVVGTGYGWVFAEAGHEVVHLMRPGRAAQAGKEIPFDLLDRRPGHPETLATTYRPIVTEAVSSSDGFDLVMVPVKHYQLVDTLRQLTAALPDARYLLFAANWDGLAGVDALLPRSQFAWGYSSSTGGHGGEELVLNVSADYRCGPIDGAEPEWAQDVVDLFASADVAPDRKADMAQWLLVHFAQAAGTIGTGLYVGGQRELYEDTAAIRDLMVPAVRECIAVLAARGVDPSAWPDLAPYLTSSAEELAAAMHATLPTPWVQRACRAGHFLENAEEMKRFYLDVLGTGEELGVPMPVMQSFRERITAL